MIEIEGISKKYNSVLAVDNISFEVKKGEVVGFLGPNGAGKTTTLRILTGYFPPTQGRCRIAGYDIEENPVEAKKHIGYLPENNPLYHEMKVVEYLEFAGRLREIENLWKRIKEVVEICKIGEVVRKNIGELSKGYKQRVGLAQAILHQPDILIMDEPTEGLDPNQVVEVRGLIKELGKEKTVLLSTHRLSEVEVTCERILIINRGRIVADGSREELHRMWEGKEVVEVEIKGESEDIYNKLKTEPIIKNIKIKNKTSTSISLEIEAEIDPRERVYEMCVSNSWVLVELHRQKVSLENVFRELTQ
jgi:ABC-2 type transport system ATP-binding protein